MGNFGFGESSTGIQQSLQQNYLSLAFCEYAAVLFSLCRIVIGAELFRFAADPVGKVTYRGVAAINNLRILIIAGSPDDGTQQRGYCLHSVNKRIRLINERSGTVVTNRRDTLFSAAGNILWQHFCGHTLLFLCI